MAAVNFQIPFDPTGLEAHTAAALDDVVSSLQSQLNRKQQQTDSSATFVQPRCRLFRSTNQTITTALETAVTWTVTGHNHAPDSPIDGLQFDTGETYGNLFRRTSDEWIVPPIGGMYLLIGAARFETDATGLRMVSLKQRGRGGGTPFELARTQVMTVTTGNPTRLQASAIVQVRTPGLYGFEDAFEMTVFQNSGGDLDVESGFANTYIEMIKLS